jgi:hypothetical protein
MAYIKCIPIKPSPLWCTMFAILSLMFCAPNVTSSAEKYYYLHISSFRSEKRAVKHVETIRNQGYDAVTRRERVPNKGYWYRVYIGPFSSLQEVTSKKEELISRRLSDYVAIIEKEDLIKSDIGQPPEKEERKFTVEPKREIPKVSPTKELTPSPIEEPGEVPPTPEKPPAAAKEVPTSLPSMEEREVVKAPPPAAPTRPPVEISAEPPRKKAEMTTKGRGRNMGRGNFSLGLRHTYRKVLLELTKRTRITSDGTTTIIEDVSVTNGEKGDHFARLHMDSLRARFGLTDYLEIFGEIDGAYRELSSLGFAYGGGLRLNLFQVKGGWFRGFYSALQGEYLSGEVEYEYSSSTDSNWKRKADWEEFIAKGELGFVRPRFNAYIGAAYFDYHEDTERELLENLPPSLTSFVLQDELEEKESFGAFGGIDINLSSAVLVNIEGQVITQKSIFGTLEYHF